MDEQQLAKLKYHCTRWLKYFETHDKLRCYGSYIDREKLPEEYLSFGLEMDCFNSLQESYLHRHNLKEISTSDNGKMLEEETDIQIIGNAMFSQLRYLNHWAYNSFEEFDKAFFIKSFRKIVGE